MENGGILKAGGKVVERRWKEGGFWKGGGIWKGGTGKKVVERRRWIVLLLTINLYFLVHTEPNILHLNRTGNGKVSVRVKVLGVYD